MGEFGAAQALQKSEAARTLAQEQSYPTSLVASRCYAAMSHQLRRESLLAQEWAEAGIILAREQGIPLGLGSGTVLHGWALSEQGQSEEEITLIRQGLATHEAIGVGYFRSYYLAMLAETYGKAGQAENGLAALAEALAVVDKSGERFYEAELYRLKGELTLAQPKIQGPQSKVQDAEECFLRAIEIARRQQA
jgi:predicted ATPase